MTLKRCLGFFNALHPWAGWCALGAQCRQPDGWKIELTSPRSSTCSDGVRPPSTSLIFIKKKRKKNPTLFSYNTAVFWVSSACPEHSTELWCTYHRRRDGRLEVVRLHPSFMPAREHRAHFSAAGLLPVTVVLDGLGVQCPHCLIRSRRSMRNQRKRVLGKPGPCPQGMSCRFLLLISLLPCCKHLQLNFSKPKTVGHLTAAQ